MCLGPMPNRFISVHVACLHEATGGGVVLPVLLQVRRQLRHARRQLCDLHLRGAGVRLRALKLRHLRLIGVDAAVPCPASDDSEQMQFMCPLPPSQASHRCCASACSMVNTCAL